MIKGLFYAMLIWLALSGCNDTIAEILPEESAPRIIESNLNKAIYTATRALQAMSKTTRNNKSCLVRNIYPVLSGGVATRSSNVDTLLYLINYREKNNEVITGISNTYVVFLILAFWVLSLETSEVL